MKWLIPLLLALLSFFAQAETRPLRPEEAFQVSLLRLAPNRFEARFVIVPGHYLYRDRFAFEAAQTLTATLPAGMFKDEPETGRVEVYPATISIMLESQQALADDQAITLRFQGCEEGRLCYPQQEVRLLPGQRSDAFSLALNRTIEPARALSFSPTQSAPTPHTATTDAYFGQSHAATLALFLLAGLGLSFTACLYPLIPIVSSLILGQQGQSRARALALTFCYVQGLALSYTAIGIAAAATGTLLTVAMQQPWVIASFALFFGLMALAMFGMFNFHLPTSWLSHITAWANRLPGGHFGPVFAMGAISALIVGPCNLPPLAAALAYLGRSGNLWLGGGALYAMAIGMGLPLLALAWFGHIILPRLSGRQMQAFRAVFGVILAGFALWIAQPLWQTSAPAEKTVVRTQTELENVLQRAQGRPLLLDFYADWCVSCVEMEKKTFADSRIQAALHQREVIRIDITANTDATRQLLTRFGLFAPPALVFVDHNGTQQGSPLIGFIDADGLLAHLASLSAADAPTP